MKDVLEYTKEELEQLPNEELQKLLAEAEDLETLYDVRQKVEKLLINGLYGALAAKYFPLFNEDIAAAITGNGRYFIQKLAKYIEKELQRIYPQEKPYIVYGDTDSVYFHIEPFIERYIEKNPGLTIDEYVTWADNFEKKVIQPIIKNTIDDFAYELNAHNKDVIGAEREIIADAGVFSAKKKYFARVRDSEGTRYPDDDPYIKVMGLEIIKSSTPKWAKKYLKEAIPHILDKDEAELQKWVQSIKQEYIKAPLIDISHGGGVSNLNYNLQTDKGIPIGSRAALIHNKYIKDSGNQELYTEIYAGDKCKRLFLIEPNPLNSNIVAFTNDAFIKEIKGYIDYDTNFEKTFLNPLNLMIESLKWDMNKETEVLDDW